jgi:filamentous hemagglutinin family protein
MSGKNMYFDSFKKLAIAIAQTLTCQLAIILSANCAIAQITPDGTLPNNSSFKLEDNTRIIEGGTRAGTNLFHSFSEFSVPNRSTAFFNNPLDIQNILTRVTGNSISNINGLIRTQGTANLFLINPNGIVFGQNARLNVGGSFVATTANEIGFGNQGFFSATNPNNPALLTINPTALFYNQIAATASIQNNSSATGLRVPNGKSLLLVGSDITMNNGDLFAFGGRVELGGLAAPGTIELVSNNNNDLSLSFPANVQRADVSLSNGARVDVEKGGGGNIVVNARNLNITGGSVLNGGIEQGLASVGAQAGDITLNATGEIKVAQSSIYNDVGSNTLVGFINNDGNIVGFPTYGNGGNINISSGSLSLTNGAYLSASTYGQGDAGSVKINAETSVTVSNSSVRSNVSDSNLIYQGFIYFFSGRGKSGGISIDTGSLTVANSAELNSSTTGRGIGRAGNIVIKARDQVLFNNGFALSRLELGGIGKAGDISITTDGSVLVTGVPSNTADARIGQLVSATFGEGDAGSIMIKAGNNVEFDGRGSDAYTLVAEDRGVGNAGNITINSLTLSVRNGARLVTTTESQGDAGSVDVTASDSVSLNNGSILSFVNPSGNGKGGNININTNSLSLTNGAEFATATSGRGDAGNIKIEATDSVNISGSSSDRPSKLRTATDSNSTGKGGNITVGTQNLRVSDGGLLDARTENNSDGGSITLKVKQAEILNGGRVVSTSSSAGNAGKITIDATDRVIINGSNRAFNDLVAPFGTAVEPIEASTGLFVLAQSTGSAGNIDVTAPQIRLNNTVRLNAESTLGSGGDIILNFADLLLRRGSRISTSAGTAGTGGDGGNITINAPNGFIVAVPNENSDITANAYTGSGGRVQINASGIYGTQFRELENPLTSDITASSEFGASGTVIFNTLNVDPSKGLVPLTIDVVDVARLVGDNICARTAKSNFAYIGRGGLPTSPNNTLNSNAMWEDWRLTGVQSRTEQQSRENSKSPLWQGGENNSSYPTQIVEAQSWIIENGEVTLIANAPTMAPREVGSSLFGC